MFSTAEVVILPSKMAPVNNDIYDIQNHYPCLRGQRIQYFVSGNTKFAFKVVYLKI